jgi:Domain of unknown function (DUF4331)
MKKLSLIAAAVAAAVAVPLSFGSSHREAPNIMLDPAADNTDTYAFKANDAPNALTVVADWIPGEVPANGPNFFRFDDRADYYINFDNNGDGKADIRYLFKFKTKVRNKNSFLYAGPGTQDYSGLNVIQRYNVVRETFKRRAHHRTRVRKTTVARGLPVAPQDIGPKTFPNYQNFVNGAIRNLHGGGKIFAGSRDDPFFVDLGATFDALNVRVLTGNKGQGKDDFSGYSTHAVVLQLPEHLVTKDHKSVSGPTAKNAVVGVWSTTERKRLQVTDQAGISRKAKRSSRNGNVQVSRLGNPLVNEVVIPLGKKDQFNRTTPDRDAKLYGKYVLKPELAGVLNALFNIGAPTTNRTDIVQALLTGIPKLNQHVGKYKNVAKDTLKINLGIPPTANPNRFGVIGGDNAGFPNGRRLGDDVVDIELQVIAGFLKNNKVPLGDGVDRNDKSFLPTFPYLAAPTSGFDSNPSNRTEPAHPPVGPGGS